MPFFLILGAIIVVAVATLVVIWVQLHRRIAGAENSATATLTRRVDAAEEEIQNLRNRIEDLETIATADELPSTS